MRLMVVDDSNIIRKKINRAVENGYIQDLYVIGLAEDGEQAVKMCREHQADVVTMDLTMPNMDGIQCIEALLKEFPNLLILVVSALADKATCIRALRLGAHGFLTKPFSDDQLIKALKELLRP